ncbi:hypothetical protein Cgig2_028370 [Carnegiea gigantea]|uniref:Uncharacterized protein n=1 Tax=Carnegiea gigantea TaxID=171969 RepID=A0A9Q1K1Q5_9CARY|nr:hypothetical protein Cgig2_028370 [Carnegiea gigantea]
MIIKRSLKSTMPTLKRCRVIQSSVHDDDGSSPDHHRKRRKQSAGGGYFPLSLLGEVAAGVIPFGGYGLHPIISGADSFRGFSASWCTEVSCSPGEVEESDSKRSEKTMEKTRPVAAVSKDNPRPPLVRTSRGSSSSDEEEYGNGYDDDDEDYEEHVSRRDRKGLNVRRYSGSRSTLTSLRERHWVEDMKPPVRLHSSSHGMLKENHHMVDNGSCDSEEFVSGDIVWAKSGKNDPAWPAIVINPSSQAPRQVLEYRVPKAVCVMFFGYSGNGRQRDYAWVKPERVFPFVDNVDRFQEQACLDGCVLSNFHKAIEEAFLAENGFTETLMNEISMAAGNSACVDSISRGMQEATGSNHYQELRHSNQARSRLQQNQTTCLVSSLNGLEKARDAQSCEGCGAGLPLKMKKAGKSPTSEGHFYCTTCAKSLRLKQYCGICKKIGKQSDSGKWNAGYILNFVALDLGATDYYCPDCKVKFNFELSDSENCQSKVRLNKNNDHFKLPDKVDVVCSGMEGIYFPSLHLVVCKCGFCGTEKQQLSDWERHTGSKVKNWKKSIRVKGSMLTLEQWMLQMAEYHAQAAASAKPPKKPSMKLRKQKLLSFLQEKYQPVYASGQQKDVLCVDGLRIGITIKSLSAIECYGARNVRDLTSWVCRACETPDIERECCLCPVKGGALKPTDVDTLWVHVTCAWFRPEVSFASDEKMEPALGILSIPSSIFVKVV